MNLITTKRWDSKVGGTCITLSMNDNSLDFPYLVICDNVDPRSNFYLYSRDLGVMERIGEEIIKLVRVARKK